MIPCSSETKQHMFWVSHIVCDPKKSFCPKWHLASDLSLDKEPKVPRKELCLGLMVPSSWVCEACLRK